MTTDRSSKAVPAEDGLRELQVLSEAATPGPWIVTPDTGSYGAEIALRAALAEVPVIPDELDVEPDWRAVVHEAMRRYHLPNDSDERVADIAIGAMEGHGFVARLAKDPTDER